MLEGCGSGRVEGAKIEKSTIDSEQTAPASLGGQVCVCMVTEPRGQGSHVSPCSTAER